MPAGEAYGGERRQERGVTFRTIRKVPLHPSPELADLSNCILAPRRGADCTLSRGGANVRHENAASGLARVRGPTTGDEYFPRNPQFFAPSSAIGTNRESQTTLFCRGAYYSYVAS